MTMTNEERKARKGWKSWPAPVKVAVDAANQAMGVEGDSPNALAEILGIHRASIYQWKTEVPANHAITLYRQLLLSPSLTCPSKYPPDLAEERHKDPAGG